MTIISVIQHKGGVGASTFRAALALVAAANEKCVLLAGDPDMLAMMGEPDSDSLVVINDCVAVRSTAPDYMPEAFDLMITDGPHDNADHTIVATRGDYLALRRGVADERTAAASGFVMWDEPKRSLNVRDVTNVLGIPCAATIRLDPAVARAIDSGLLTRRVPQAIAAPARHVLFNLGVIEAETADA